MCVCVCARVRAYVCTKCMPGAHLEHCVQALQCLPEKCVCFKWVYIFLCFLHVTLFTSQPTCVLYIVYRSRDTVCVGVWVSLAWGSSSCVKVSRSKCLKSQKRKKRRSKGKEWEERRRKGEVVLEEWIGGGGGSDPGGRREKQQVAEQKKTFSPFSCAKWSNPSTSLKPEPWEYFHCFTTFC